ncbi:MAG: phosphatidylserine decarboxylase [Gammaproteobacteria bacterium]|nr:phosphatidylserine decarboxylase [Gammaproteobacteria bacterium]
MIRPSRILSWCVYKFSRIRIRLIKNTLIGWFMRRYKINLSEFQREAIEDYSTFNDFFTREIKSELRPILGPKNAVISPVDGFVVAYGKIDGDTIIQLKNSHYSLYQLVNENEKLKREYMNGYFATIYLAPNNYHRVHMPLDGTLKNSELIPGKIFSVNQNSLKKIPNLYIKNQRLINVFNGPISPFILILVAALNVSSITTSWLSAEGEKGKTIMIAKGEEMGRFNLGSTVLLLFPQKTQLKWLDSFNAGGNLKMGEMIAEIKPNN